MGRGSSGIDAKKTKANGGAGVRVEQIAPPPARTLRSKNQVNELTAGYTPEQFLGDTDLWTGSVASAREMAEGNMPESLEIGGYTFKRLGMPDAQYVSDGMYKGNVVVIMDYQSNEKVGNEYPVIQVGVRIRRFRGKIQTEIIRDNAIYGTRFW